MENRSKTLVVFLIGIILLVASRASAESQERTGTGSPSLLSRTEALIGQKKFAEAKSSLQAFVAGMPAGWKPVTEEGDNLRVAYWDLEHFLACALRERESGNKKRLVWARPSYSKAYYLLAFISLETGRKAEAKQHIDRALELEPDHPLLLCEKGLILQTMSEHEEAVGSFDTALRSKGCVTGPEKARALRGKGVSLIDLGRLDEAEQAFTESLKIAPGNRIALDELEYIRRIRAGGRSTAPIGLTPTSPE